MQKVSVIIPTFNCAAYLAQTINSVLNQTYGNYELIIVDDGSKDDTRQLIDSLMKKNSGKIRYLYQDNQGVSVARNRGMAEAQGEFIAFLDSDDWWAPQKLAKQMSMFQSDRSLDIIFTNAHIFKNGKVQGTYVRDTDKNQMGEDIYYHLLLRNFVVFSSIAVKRSAAEEVGPFEKGMISAQDTDWLLRVVRSHKTGYIDECLVTYQVRSDSLSRFMSIRFQNYLDILKKNIARYPEISDKLGQKLTNRFAQRYFYLGYVHFDTNDLLAARREFINSMKYNPFSYVQKYLYFALTFLPVSCIEKIRHMKRRFSIGNVYYENT